MHLAHEHATLNYRQYFTTWFWLLVMTLLALTVGYVSMPEGIKALLLVGITLAKIVLIASIFMHLRFERLNLVMITLVPLILSIILFFFTHGETAGSATHILMVR
jgi:caa(3)-type oxidase subunit IV